MIEVREETKSGGALKIMDAWGRGQDKPNGGGEGRTSTTGNRWEIAGPKGGVTQRHGRGFSRLGLG